MKYLKNNIIMIITVVLGLVALYYVMGMPASWNYPSEYCETNIPCRGNDLFPEFKEGKTQAWGYSNTMANKKRIDQIMAEAATNKALYESQGYICYSENVEDDQSYQNGNQQVRAELLICKCNAPQCPMPEAPEPSVDPLSFLGDIQTVIQSIIDTVTKIINGITGVFK